MYIKSLRISNFKSVDDLTIHFDRHLSILTGVNNCGKTTILEAVSLWAECFSKLLHKAQRASPGKFAKGDYMFGPLQNRYFNFEDINSVRSPDFEDIFRDRNIKMPILLSATIENEQMNESMEIGFIVKSSSSSRYDITLNDEKNFNYNLFNRIFDHLAEGGVSAYYSSPVAFIEQRENHATDPQIKDSIIRNRSYQVIRNRIYNLYDKPVFASFEQDVSYVLFGVSQMAKLKFVSRSRMNENVRVIINYTLNNEPVEKDLALLGSGSLQVIEILLDLYHQSETKRDMFLILLDEPDSHIHRDIQNRLLQILSHSKFQNQVIVTTHNESLIRSASLANLFHLDGSGKGEVRCLYNPELPKLNQPHFRGIYPALETPTLRSLGGSKEGMDFVSAIESDKIVFVEGDDDARVLYKLFMTEESNKTTKLMFWVLGGISKVMDKVEMYKAFFSDIRNNKSLWDKSLLVFDRDSLTEEHLGILQKKLEEKYGLRSFCHKGYYTQESVVLSDTQMLAELLGRFLQSQKVVVDKNQLEQDLKVAIQNQEPVIKDHYSKIDDDYVDRYEGMYISKINSMLNQEERKQLKLKKAPIARRDELKAFYNRQQASAMSRKEDVAAVINNALKAQGINMEVDESVFYDLVAQADRHMMYPEWKELREFLES